MSEHIVIAEDDEDLAFVLREALRRQRYEPEVAPTAGALLDKLKATAYDLILLDVRLPDMDGLDAIPRCRELAPDTPIIVMTAHGTRQTAMDAGFAAVLRDAVTARDLAQVLRQAVANIRAR